MSLMDQRIKRSGDVCQRMSVLVRLCVCLLLYVCSSVVCQEGGSCCLLVTDCNAPVIPLLAVSTVPAIKFPKSEELN